MRDKVQTKIKYPHYIMKHVHNLFGMLVADDNIFCTGTVLTSKKFDELRILIGIYYKKNIVI